MVIPSTEKIENVKNEIVKIGGSPYDSYRLYWQMDRTVEKPAVHWFIDPLVCLFWVKCDRHHWHCYYQQRQHGQDSQHL